MAGADRVAGRMAEIGVTPEVLGEQNVKLQEAADGIREARGQEPRSNQGDDDGAEEVPGTD